MSNIIIKKNYHIIVYTMSVDTAYPQITVHQTHSHSMRIDAIVRYILLVLKAELLENDDLNTL